MKYLSTRNEIVRCPECGSEDISLVGTRMVSKKLHFTKHGISSRSLKDIGKIMEQPWYRCCVCDTDFVDKYDSVSPDDLKSKPIDEIKGEYSN